MDTGHPEIVGVKAHLVKRKKRREKIIIAILSEANTCLKYFCLGSKVLAQRNTTSTRRVNTTWFFDNQADDRNF